MPDASDMELLADYVRNGSEEAFATVVQRHVNLVYSVALRHVGIPAQAEDVTQAVFVVLSRKAAGLSPSAILEGWLYETARLTSLSFIRSERRRQFREQEVYMQLGWFYFSGDYYIAFSTRLNRMTLHLANLPISRQEILNELASVMI